ncbi:MAG TPA: molecular chaperone TorD family protein [Gemmataceae bacterium]|jgi:TorA maturation chaperone TorD
MGTIAEDTALAVASEFLYHFLAAAVSDPFMSDVSLVLNADGRRLAISATELLRQEASESPIPLGFGELPPSRLDWTSLSIDAPLSLNDLRAAHADVFGLVLPRECPPYETEYCSSAEAFFRAQQLADIAGFYRAFGIQTTHASPERPDHLALELEFMAFLLRKERLACTAEQTCVCADAQRSFLRDHLAWWVPSFAAGLRRKAERGFYATVAQVLAAFMPAERARLGVAAPSLPMRPALIERPEEQAGCTGCVAT